MTKTKLFIMGKKDNSELHRKGPNSWVTKTKTEAKGFAVINENWLLKKNKKKTTLCPRTTSVFQNGTYS